MKKVISIALALAALAALLIAVVPVLNPSFDEKKVAMKLVGSKDLDFEASLSDNPASIESYPLNEFDFACQETHDIGTSLSSSSTVGAVTLNGTFEELDEEVFAFKNDSQALKFIKLFKSAASDKLCRHNDPANVDGYLDVVSGIGDVQAKFGVGGTNSVTFRYHMHAEEPGGLLDYKDTFAVVASGRYVVYVRAYRDLDSTVSDAQIDTAVSVTLKKMLG